MALLNFQKDLGTLIEQSGLSNKALLDQSKWTGLPVVMPVHVFTDLHKVDISQFPHIVIMTSVPITLISYQILCANLDPPKKPAKLTSHYLILKSSLVLQLTHDPLKHRSTTQIKIY